MLTFGGGNNRFFFLFACEKNLVCGGGGERRAKLPLLLLVPTRVGKDDMFVISYKRKLIFYLLRRCDEKAKLGYPKK